MRIVPPSDLKRLWSIHVAVFWSAVGAFVLVVPLIFDKLNDYFDWRLTGGLLFLAATTFGVARALKQPGTDSE